MLLCVLVETSWQLPPDEAKDWTVLPTSLCEALLITPMGRDLCIEEALLELSPDYDLDVS